MRNEMRNEMRTKMRTWADGTPPLATAEGRT